MRIRKLAQELGVHEEVLLGLALEMGLGRYADSEQQLGKEAETRLRLAVRRRPPEVRTAALRSEYLSNKQPVRPHVPGQVDELSQMIKGVKPLQPATTTKAPPAKAPKSALKTPVAAPKSTSVLLQPAVPAAKAPPPLKTPVVEPKVVTPVTVDPEQEQLREENRLLRARLEEKNEQAGYLATRLTRLLEEQERWMREKEAIEAEKVRWEEERNTLKQNLEQWENRPGPVPIKKVLERRGLIGESEMGLALRGLLEAHWEAPLLSRLLVEDADGLRDFLYERLILVGEGDDPLPGMVALKVSSDRSEADPGSAVRDALRRFSTACLIHNLKNIVIVGGSPAYHRQLREGVDSRLRVKLVPGDRRGRLSEYPSAEVVILWGSTILDHSVSEHYPDGWLIPHRGIARMLNAASDRIEGKNR